MPTCEPTEPREVLRGAGPCDIKFEVKKRSGKPNWWCHTHGMDASAPDGNRLDACPGKWFDPVPDELQLDLDLSEGQVAVWGALPPAIQIGVMELEPGKVHVHRRQADGELKDLDASFDIVRVRYGAKTLVIEGKAATAYSLSELSGRSVVALLCRHCGGLHIDELKFATFPHRKHLCNSCGRNFIDTSGPSISNPLANARDQLGLPPALPSERPDKPLEINTPSFRAVMVWPSNTAILSTMTRPEELGFHVHAWDEHGVQVHDDTFSSLRIDGIEIDERSLRMLAVQKSLAHGVSIQSLACGHCGESLTTSTDAWIEPRTTHVCTSCDGVTKTRRKVYLNPLAEKQA